MITKPPLLCAKDLYFTYVKGDDPALHGVSLSLQRGEICGLIGPNGAGKTTLISILTTLARPAEGSLVMCGEDALESPNNIRGKIGFVPQDLAIYNRLTGFENLMYFGRMYGIEKKRLREKAKYYLDMFGLYEKSSLKVSTYSGGMKRRINLLIGILHGPQILFLDEPTVGIDAQSRHLIIEKLATFNDDGMTMVYTSHYIEEVQQLCPRVIVIDAGEIVAEGISESLVQQLGGCTDLAEFFFKKTGKQLRD